MKFALSSYLYLLYRHFRAQANSALKRMPIIVFKMTGYYLYEFSGAFLATSLFLVLTKILSYLVLGFQLPFFFNLTFWVFYFFLSLKYNIYFYLRYITYKLIKNILGSYFFGLLEDTWFNTYKQMRGNHIFHPVYQDDESTEIKNWPKTSLSNFIAIFICTFLIFIRLCLLSEPYLFAFIRFIVIYWLLFNKFLLLAYIITFLIVSSTLIMFFQTSNYNDFKQLFWKTTFARDANMTETIKPTIKNAFYVLLWITNLIKMDKDEEADIYFYVTKKDRNIKIPKNATYFEEVANISIFYISISQFIKNIRLKNYNISMFEVKTRETKINLKKAILLISIVLSIYIIYKYSIEIKNMHDDINLIENSKPIIGKFASVTQQKIAQKSQKAVESVNVEVNANSSMLANDEKNKKSAENSNTQKNVETQKINIKEQYKEEIREMSNDKPASNNEKPKNSRVRWFYTDPRNTRNMFKLEDLKKAVSKKHRNHSVIWKLEEFFENSGRDYLECVNETTINSARMKVGLHVIPYAEYPIIGLSNIRYYLPATNERKDNIEKFGKELPATDWRVIYIEKIRDKAWSQNLEVVEALCKIDGFKQIRDNIQFTEFPEGMEYLKDIYLWRLWQLPSECSNLSDERIFEMLLDGMKLVTWEEESEIAKHTELARPIHSTLKLTFYTDIKNALTFNLLNFDLCMAIRKTHQRDYTTVYDETRYIDRNKLALIETNIDPFSINSWKLQKSNAVIKTSGFDDLDNSMNPLKISDKPHSWE